MQRRQACLREAHRRLRISGQGLAPGGAAFRAGCATSSGHDLLPSFSSSLPLSSPLPPLPPLSAPPTLFLPLPHAPGHHNRADISSSIWHWSDVIYKLNNTLTLTNPYMLIIPWFNIPAVLYWIYLLFLIPRACAPWSSVLGWKSYYVLNHGINDMSRIKCYSKLWFSRFFVAGINWFF